MAKDKDGFIGEWEEGMLMDLITGEAKDAEPGDIQEVGYIDPPPHYNSLSGHLFKQQMQGTIIKLFYMLGNVSARQKLRYVRLNHNVLMGFADNYGGGNGSVYYFRHCGEIEDVPVFTYMSDMVIKEDEIIWVQPLDHTRVPNEIRQKGSE